MSAEPPYFVDVFVSGADGRPFAVWLVPAWCDVDSRWPCWVLWCPTCGARHFHGRLVEEPTDQIHRGSHCVTVEHDTYRLYPMPGRAPTRRPSALADAARKAAATKRARQKIA
jgi:hypothetical protein